MKNKKNISLILIIFSIFMFFNCSGVELAKPKSVADYFCKALIKGDMKQAKELSTLSDDVIKKYLSRIKNKYKDFRMNEFKSPKVYKEVVSFIPNKIDNPELRLTLILTFSGKIIGDKGRRAATVIRIEEGNLSKEQIVKLFIKSLISGKTQSILTYTTASKIQVKNIAAKINGANSFEIIQLTETDENVMAEIKKGDKTVILNLKVKKESKTYKITELKTE